MINWRVHRAKEYPQKTVLGSLIVLLVIVFLVVFYGLAWAVLAAIILFASLNAYFLPITYIFTDSEIIIDKKLFKNKLEWTRFRKYYKTQTGIVLSPFSNRTYLDNFRGIHLLLPKNDAAKTEEIIVFIKQKLALPDSAHDNQLSTTNPDNPKQV